MKIHAQPAIPLMPSIFSIAAASSPENAPEREAMAKNIEILRVKSRNEVVEIHLNKSQREHVP